MQRLQSGQRLERAVGDAAQVVVVQRQQVQLVQAGEQLAAQAFQLVGVQEQKLQVGKGAENVDRQVGDVVGVQDERVQRGQARKRVRLHQVDVVLGQIAEKSGVYFRKNIFATFFRQISKIDFLKLNKQLLTASAGSSWA